MNPHRTLLNESFRNRFLTIMSESSALLLRQPNDCIDDAITEVLGVLGRLLGADRSYVFQFHNENHFMDNTHEWCEDGVSSEMANLKGLPVDLFQYWMGYMLRNELLYIPDVDALPPEASAEKEVLAQQNIRSLVAIPMFAGDRVSGFIGLDAVGHFMHWEPESIEMLRVAGNIIISAILRNRSEILLNEELDLAFRIRESGSLKETLTHCLETALSVSNMPSGGIYVLRSQDNNLELLVHRGLSGEFVRKVSHYEADSPAYRMLMSMRPNYMSVSKLQLPDTGYVKNEGLDTLAIIPILYREQVVAAMNIASPYVGGFPEHVRKQLETIASHIGSAIHLAKKDEETRLATSNLKTLFNTIDDVILVCDSSGRILFTNDAAVCRTGYTKEAIIGRSVLDLLPEGEKQLMAGKLGDFSGKKPDTTKFRIGTSGGEVIPVEINVSESSWDNSSALICVCRDITEQQKAEEILHETMRMKEGLLGRFERISVVRTHLIGMLNTASVEDILQVTLDEAERMTGSSLGFFHFVRHQQLPVSTHVWSTNTLKHHGAILNEYNISKDELISSRFWSELLAGKRPLIHNRTGLTIHGTNFPEWHPGISRTLIVPVIRDNQIMALLGVGNSLDEYDEEIVRWVTALADQAWEIVENKLYLERQNKLQEQLGQAKKMEMIGRLAAGIAHEINNPLNYVRLNISNLENDFNELSTMLARYRLTAKEDRPVRPDAMHSDSRQDPGVPLDEELLREIPEILEATRNGIERINGIILSMRNFTSRNMANTISSFDLNRAVQDVFAIAGNECRTCAVLESELGPVPGVSCNPLQINQVLLNLVMNGIHAIRSQHRRALGRILVRTWAEDSAVFCSVSDDGPGIPENIRGQIFEPFFTTKEPREGTGLGLSISYDIVVHKHHGTLSFECSPEGGTTFTIALPLD